MQIKPLGDRVLAEPITQTVTDGGIYLPAANAERSQIMRVVNAGEASRIEIGTQIIVNKYSGAEINISGKKQYIVRIADILAAVYEEERKT
jgi:co-chaperonin GroES (HSP10)